ncbi:MAG: type II secretion system protein [Richelia sp. RM2_1_2]|nr:type II secretion system protein [Richelia sp. SM1_7_0]NJN09783.1 type II secretion system protein [Richelia sp. RM1_1_1]NJO60591.1 type II secretion system protein [Richelia sp. RM2_1_2]
MLKRQLQQLALKNNQAGFTIIESLVAVIVLGILMTAIAPTIVLSTATRVQSRRIELASLAARAYIDGVSSGNIPAPPISASSTINAPTTSLSCNDLTTDKGYCDSPKDNSSYKVYCVDGTADGKCTKEESKDLIIQAFGFNPDSTEAARGYRLSIRVYRADAFDTSKDNSPLLKSEDGKKATQSTFTGGLGKRKAPLTEITTEIVVTGQTTFKNFCSRLTDTGNTNSQCSN